MEEKVNPAKENYAVALSGMIMGALATLCAFMPAWRTFALILGLISLIICIFSLARSGASHSKKTRAVVGLCCAVVAIVVSAFYLYRGPGQYLKNSLNEMPPELTDSSAIEQDNASSLQKLQGLTDSSDSE
jgi:uncharacterized membrane protein